ncbi:PREDICTED: homeobox-leucine zipper protein HAT5-like [Tarenaya hassleriana]|uniref:homeobox-leucine zipper protein HAT5-like n=1 Tax=Tarenaya hassleriana TaxID=28532 RepID=UPI00053C3A93|nr:PREDICTED: homeobox-leucine zipper protein HAT5-like [Tarenaya hassleriana]
MICSREMQSGSCVNWLSRGNLDLVLQGTNSVMEKDESSRRRFSMISGNLFNQEYYHHRVQERKHRLTAGQVNLLEESFQEENKLEPQRKIQLAKRLGLPPRQVAVWFQNRKARSKVKQIEQEYELLKSSYDSLREKHELVLEENENLKSKVLTLTEKLQSNGTDPEMATNQNARSFTNEINLEPNDDNRTSHAALRPTAEDQGNFSDVFMAAEQQPDNEEPFNWWVWSSISQPLW